MDSSDKGVNNEQPKTPLENLQDILAKADALAAAGVPLETKAIFTIEGEEPQSADTSIPKSRLRSVLAAVQQLTQEWLSRQRLTDLLTGDLCHDKEMIFSENIKKLDELIKAFKLRMSVN